MGPTNSTKTKDAAVADDLRLTREHHDLLSKQLARLDAQEQRLIDLAADGLLDRGKIHERSNQLAVDRARIEADLADASTALHTGADRLRAAVELATNPAALYRAADDWTREQLNMAFYERLYLDDDPLAVRSTVLRPPFDELQEASLAYQRYRAISLGNGVATDATRRDESVPAGADRPGGLPTVARFPVGRLRVQDFE